MSVFLSGSRGGAIALAAEFAIFGLILWRVGSRRLETGNWKLRTGLMACSLLLAAGAFFSWLDPGDIWKRWEQVSDSPELAVQDRITIAKDSLRLARAHLAYGVGVGAFEVVYPKYQTVATDALIDHAHNDYAELLAEAGILGWVLIPVSLGTFLWQAFRRLRGTGNGARKRETSSLATGHWPLTTGLSWVPPSEFAASWCIASPISTCISRPTQRVLSFAVPWQFLAPQRRSAEPQISQKPKLPAFTVGAIGRVFNFLKRLAKRDEQARYSL